MTRSIIQAIVGTQIFAVSFTKADGSNRDMVCRLGVTKHLNPHSKGLTDTQKLSDIENAHLRVFDVQKGAYRKINCNTINRIAVKGLVYENLGGQFALVKGELNSRQRVLIDSLIGASNIIEKVKL